MSVFEDYVYRQFDQAVTERAETAECLAACADLPDPEVAKLLANAARARGTAEWWDRVIAGHEEQHPGALDAVLRERECALHVLTDQSVPRCGDPFQQGFAIARIESACEFYATTAYLEALACPVWRCTGPAQPPTATSTSDAGPRGTALPPQVTSSGHAAPAQMHGTAS